MPIERVSGRALTSLARCCERFRRVACFASLAEVAAVYVVGAVTRDATLACSRTVAFLSLVASAANQIGVLPGQRKLRLSVVIEPPERPAVRIVAIAAAWTQGSLVLVVFCMAHAALV